MFGFSLAKLLVLAAIIAAVWYGFKIIGRRNQGPKVADDKPDAGRIAAEDTVECPRCATFVVPGGATSCGRADCPYPG
jgi:uncharacterized protein